MPTSPDQTTTEKSNRQLNRNQLDALAAARARRGAKTRQAILDATRELAQESGATPSRREISGRSGVPIRTTEYHFPILRDLLTVAGVRTIVEPVQ